MGPRDAPRNYATGEPLSTRQELHLAALTEAGEKLYAAMHEAEGSSHPGEHQDHVFMSRRMSIAATNIETALMYARKAALETR